MKYTNKSKLVKILWANQITGCESLLITVNDTNYWCMDFETVAWKSMIRIIGISNIPIKRSL